MKTISIRLDDKLNDELSDMLDAMGIAYTREDGVHVAPFACLKN